MTTLPLTGRWGPGAAAEEAPLDQTLAGRRFALASVRKLDLFAGMLTKRGADLLRVPLWSHWPAARDPDAQAWVEAIIAGRARELVWLSPDGVACATRVAAALEQDWALVKAMRRCRHFARGRMTAVALQRMGVICADFTRDADNKALQKALARHRITRCRVALQLHRVGADRDMDQYLRWLRCEVRATPLYHLPAERETTQVQALIDRLIAGRLDGLFVSELSEVGRLFNVADQTQSRKALHAAIRRTALITFSPRVAGDLQQVGLKPDIVPPRTFGLRPLAGLIEKHFARRS
jgi:uroporphyrinogen-III synthase